jgi:hypothetical protein
MIVTIDGVEYSPAGSSRPKSDVAIAITTRNRPDVLARCLKQIEAVTPANFPVFVVDDASDPPAIEARNTGIRFPQNVGIPRAKNACIDLCMASGANHFFLLDDDCWPVAENWWQPYTFSPEPHFNYIFVNWTNGTPVGDCVELYNDGKMRAFDQARGCAIYLERRVIEKVGGFDPIFGLGMEEHLEYSRRICNAGLATFPFQDVVDSDELWYSVDRAQAGTRTIPTATRQSLLALNRPLAEERKNSVAYIPYADKRNLVVTQLLTRNVDGQRGVKWSPDAEIVEAWRRSIKGAKPVVLHDEQINGHLTPGLFVRTESGWPIPHLQRWVSSLQYLKTVDAQWVWLTDGSDVEMLREPWDEMRVGTLYVGDEPCTIGKPWLTEHHQIYGKWIGNNRHLPMLNCGLVGGDYATVLEFLGDMVRELARAYGHVDYEMGSFNYLLRQAKWFDRVEHGPLVNTLFKHEERDNEQAWWKHK